MSEDILESQKALTLSIHPSHPTRFLPSLARSALEKNLADAAIEISTANSPESDLEDYKCKYLNCFSFK